MIKIRKRYRIVCDKRFWDAQYYWTTEYKYKLIRMEWKIIDLKILTITILNRISFNVNL